jgi:hypothetical protein
MRFNRSWWAFGSLLVSAVCFAGGALAIAAEPATNELLTNGSAEEVTQGKPVHWDIYEGDGKADWGSSPDAHSGKHSVFLTARGYGVERSGARKGQRCINVSLVQGDSDGYGGAKAYRTVPVASHRYMTEPSGAYRLSCWIKGDAGRAAIFCQGWTTDEADASARCATKIAALRPARDWTKIETTFVLPDGVKRLALMFKIAGCERDGVTLGTLWVDDVSLRPERQALAEDLPLLKLPAQPHLTTEGRDFSQIRQAMAAGDPPTVQWAKRRLAEADRWAARSDAWYVDLVLPQTPRGMYTTACPIHPFLTRPNVHCFQWSEKEPWKLYCPHCVKEGRKYPYYPNPRYPDDGNGCFPTDAVWREDHDEAWSRANMGIPWEHWDGYAHGDVPQQAKGIFFKGHLANFAICRQFLPGVMNTLGLGYQVAAKVYAPGSPESARAELYAHKAKVVLLTYARAQLGDDYLAAIEGLGREEFHRRMTAFYWPEAGQSWVDRHWPGYQHSTLFDEIVTDFQRGPTSGASIFIGGWDDWRRAMYGGAWLQQYLWLRESYTPQEETLRAMTERMLVSQPGDAQRLARGKRPEEALVLKRGILEYLPSPYALVTGDDNQPDIVQGPRVALGRQLCDQKIIAAAARDIHYFLRNFFTSDGLDEEGSPGYAECSWGLINPLDALCACRGRFPAGTPYYDPASETFNPYGDPVVKDTACKFLYSLLPDGHAIAWEDSACRTRLPLYVLERIENQGGGIPPQYGAYFDRQPQKDGTRSVALAPGFTLPSRLLPEIRKAVLRAGRGEGQSVVALDFGADVPHYHDAPLSLMVYAKGHELASDLGYMSASHELMHWIRTCPAHNCCTLRAADGSPRPTEALRGDVRQFAVAPMIQVMEAGEEDPDVLKALPDPEHGVYQRTTALVNVDDENHYVVDISRARGAPVHDWYFHSHGERFAAEGVKLNAGKDPQQSLYDYSRFTFPWGPNVECRNIRRLQTGKTDGPWSASWSEVKDWRPAQAEKRVVDREVGLRLTMLGQADTEVIAGEAPAQRYLDERDRGSTMTVLCARRPEGKGLDRFAAVIEPYRGRPQIVAVEPLAVSPTDETAVGLKVATASTIDYFLSANNGEKPTVRTVRDGEWSAVTDAQWAAVSYRKGQLRWRFFTSGTFLRCGEETIQLPPEPTGAILDLDDARKSLLVRADRPMPEGAALHGRTIFISHRAGRSSFTIDRVVKVEGSRYRIHLDGTPHLVKNTLLVRSVTGDRLTVEPPPVLPRNGITRYNVYHGQSDGALRLIGPLLGLSRDAIRDEWGTAMAWQERVHVEQASAVKPGEEIALTMLCVGRDQFVVPNVCFVAK